MEKYQYRVNGKDYDVEITSNDGSLAQVLVNGKPFEVEIRKQEGVQHAAPVVRPAAAAAPQAAPAAPAHQPAEQPAAGKGAKVTAPLPGTITEICVKVGDSVNEGDTVVILEAMKMQNNIEAECAGKVTSVLVTKGDSVMEGTALITIG